MVLLFSHFSLCTHNIYQKQERYIGENIWQVL